MYIYIPYVIYIKDINIIMDPQPKKHTSITTIVNDDDNNESPLSSIVLSPPQEQQQQQHVVVIEMTLYNEELLQHIFSFVGDKQYRFIASVNHTFYKAYTALYPKRITYCNASTMEHMLLCYNEPTTKHHKLLLCESAAYHNNIQALLFLKENGCILRVLIWEKLEAVVKNGYIDVLIFAHENGTYMDRDNIIKYAIQYSHMNILEWMHTTYSSKFDNIACAHGIMWSFAYLTMVTTT
jgi:hypothetical protein